VTSRPVSGSGNPSWAARSDRSSTTASMGPGRGNHARHRWLSRARPTCYPGRTADAAPIALVCSRNERYFKIPFGYWLDAEGWHTTLSLRGKAALLIALSLPSPFILPTERAPAWYGISADTLERGLYELTARGVCSTMSSESVRPRSRQQGKHASRSASASAPSLRPPGQQRPVSGCA
jgi:hypothetical protein